MKNNQLAGWVDMQDEIRPEAAEVIAWFKKRNIKTILLSGDRKQKCMDIAKALGIDEVIAEQTPAAETGTNRKAFPYCGNGNGRRWY